MSDSENVLTAGDIMQTAVKTVASAMTLPEFEKKLLQDQVSGYPVVDGGQLVGVVSRSDIVSQICAEREVAEKTSDFYFDAAGFHEAPMTSLTDIADRIGERLERLCVGDVMAHNPLTASIDQPLSELARRFADLRIHRLPVIDGTTLVGIVTTVDLVRLIAEKRLVASR